MSTPLRELLNRARWRDGELHRLSLVVVHRGAPDDQRRIAGERVTNVLAAGVEVAPETGSEPLFLPYHRFLAVEREGGGYVWRKADADIVPLDREEPAPRPTADVNPNAPPGVEVRSEIRVLAPDADPDDALLRLDGSAGEGGGQILRTALTLSMLTGRPFAIERVRGRRKKPGLLRQHLTCLRAAAAISDAEVEGATLGSSRFVFRPRAIESGEFSFDIGSAGSVGLVLQTVALPLTRASGRSLVHLRGGTHAKWAPITPFLEQAWLPRLERVGAHMKLSVVRAGFYPAGGGEVLLEVASDLESGVRSDGALAPAHLPERCGALELELSAAVSNLPEGIARRELTAAEKALLSAGHEPRKLSSMTLSSPGPGTAIWLSARDARTGLANVFSAIGDRGVSAETVGTSVAKRFLAWRATDTGVGPHLADQLMLPMALAGAGRFTCPELSLHAWTNLEVIDAFLGRRLRVHNLGEGRFRVWLG